LPPASKKSGNRKSGSVPESVRRAVEKTVQSTIGTAGASRERAQALADDVLRRRASVADRVRDAIQEFRLIGNADDLKELRAELAALRKRVERLEKAGKKKKSKGA
jgi:polyhydroxyalkanoate synthesis regulator phasin